jgi:AcrR family transcriptional regulator
MPESSTIATPTGQPQTGPTAAPPKAPQADPRARILAAASDEFERKGYRDATIRAICTAAGVNVAAVNYHFSSKRELFDDVLEAWYMERAERYPLPEPGGRPEKRLAAYISAYVRRMLGSGPRTPAAVLRRNRVFLTEFLAGDPESRVFRRCVVGELDLLRDIVAGLLGPEGGSSTLMNLCAQSVLGQLAAHAMSRLHPATEALFPTVTPADDLARLLTDFSLAGIRAMHRSYRLNHEDHAAPGQDFRPEPSPHRRNRP